MEYVVTGAFIAFFFWVAARMLYLRLRGHRATGIIIDIVPDKASDGPVSKLVVQFTTTTGATLTEKSFSGFEGASSYYRIGEQVSILYSPENPRIFAIAGYDIAGVFLAFLLAAGACGLLYGSFSPPPGP